MVRLTRRTFCLVGSATALAPLGGFAREVVRKRRALLIGVCDYLHFPSRRLEGPAYDVPRVRDLLLGRGFSDIDVVADRQPNGVLAPTRLNILSAFQRMTERIAPGDFLFFYFSGHGAQQPVLAREPEEELDGLDEVLLPSDAGRLTEDLTIRNAIVDDELGRFIRACRERGAFVWVVIDACHSGDATRNAPLPPGARERGVPSSELGFPQWVVRLIDRFPVARRTRLGQVDLCGSSDRSSTAGGLLAFFACRSHQRTIEVPVSSGGSARLYAGLFTQVLLSQLANLGTLRTATYLDLVARVEHDYQEGWQGWDWQPQFCADPARDIAGRELFT